MFSFKFRLCNSQRLKICNRYKCRTRSQGDVLRLCTKLNNTWHALHAPPKFSLVAGETKRHKGFTHVLSTTPCKLPWLFSARERLTDYRRSTRHASVLVLLRRWFLGFWSSELLVKHAQDAFVMGDRGTRAIPVASFKAHTCFLISESTRNLSTLTKAQTYAEVSAKPARFANLHVIEAMIGAP